MPDIHNTVTNEVRLSVNLVPPFDTVPWRVIDRVEAESIQAIPQKYREWNGIIVSEMDAGEKAAVDQALLNLQRDELASLYDDLESETRAFALSVLDIVNLLGGRINAIRDAIDSANNLADVKSAVSVIPPIPTYTVAQMKSSVRSNLGK